MVERFCPLVCDGLSCCEGLFDFFSLPNLFFCLELLYFAVLLYGSYLDADWLDLCWWKAGLFLPLGGSFGF